MTATKVVSSNLVSEAWNNVYSILTDRTLFSDPSGTSSSRRKWIYSRPPDTKKPGFSYPYVVVYPATIDRGSEFRTANGQRQHYSWLIEVEIVSTDRGKNDEEGSGLALCDEIADSVFSVFNGSTVRTTLRNNGLLFSQVDGGGTPVIEAENNQLVFRRTLFLRFNGQKKVF